MKVVYVGAQSALSEAFSQRMIKEGNDTYVISDTPYHRNVKSVFQYRFYQVVPKGDAMQRVLHSIAPDCIVFAGTKLMDSELSENFEDNVAEMTLLSSVLRALSCMDECMRKIKFVLLSSTAVYGADRISEEDATHSASENRMECAAVSVNEETPVRPVSEKGILYAQEERLVELFGERGGMETVVLRVSQLYSEQVTAGGRDFLSQAYTAVLAQRDTGMAPNAALQPLHVSDFVDAIKRVIDAGCQQVYNVAGSFTVTEQVLSECLADKLGVKCPQGKGALEQNSVLIDNTRLKKELEWTDFKQLTEIVHKDRLVYKKGDTNQQAKKEHRIPTGLRRTFENLVVFAAFYAVDLVCEPHTLFSQINWLLLYVVLVSLFLGIRQSAFAVLLVSIAHLMKQHLSILEMTNFYAYAGNVLTIMEFVFLGLAVSYTMDMLREDKQNAALELALLREDYRELRKIDDENVSIKNAYEARLLESESGLPRLYQIVQKLMVLQPDRIFMEIMQVISEMVHTDTVAVYRVSTKADSSYLRLMNAMQKMASTSWNIADHQGIQEAMLTGVPYQGNVWEGEPAIVLPVMYQGHCTVLIRIDALPYESQTLYHMNLLKTLALLLTESVGRALDYEELSRREHYMEGTDILNPETFAAYVLLAKEKSRKHMAEYCVMELACTGSLESAHRQISPILRDTDYLGVDEEGRLYVLLNNTAVADAKNLRNRLSANQIKAAVTDAFDGLEQSWRVEKKGWA